MEEFVRKLVATADLSILSKKKVRQHYMTFSGKTSLTTAETDAINNFIDQLLQDILQGKEISPTRPEIKGRVKDVKKEKKDTVLCNSQPTTPKGLRKRKRSLSRSPVVKNSPKRYKKSTKKRFSLDEVVDILNKSDENGNMSDNSNENGNMSDNSDENGNTSDKSDDDQLNDSREENLSSPVSSPATNGNRERYSSDVDSSDNNDNDDSDNNDNDDSDNNDSDDSFSSGHDSESAGRSSCKQKHRKSKADEKNRSEFVTLNSSKAKPLKSSKLKRETDKKKTISSKENYTFNSKENAKNKHGRRVKTLIDTDSESEVSDPMGKASSKFQVGDSGLDVQSDSEAGSSFSDSPVKTLSRKRQVVSCIESTDSEDDEDSNSAERRQASRQFANRDSLRRAEQKQVSSDNENVEEEKQVKQRKQKSVKKSSSDTDSDEDAPLSRYSKKGEKKSEKKDDKNTSENKKNQKTSKEKKSQNKTVEYLKKICKASGIFLRGKKSLKDCTTDKEMIERMKEILKEAGMEGKPTLEKAEELRLMTEAAELDTGNILSDKSVVGKRKVQSLFSRREASPSPVKKSSFTGFRHLKGLVDSDASSDD